MDTTSWQVNFEREISLALLARRDGNEGKSRVCARRAAGVIAGEYFQRKGIARGNPSAYDRLRYLISLPDLPDDVTRIAEHFLLRITEERALPIDVDLIEEARWLAQTLLLASPGVTPSGNTGE